MPPHNSDLDDIGVIMDELTNVLAHYNEIGGRLNLSFGTLELIRRQNLSPAAAMEEVIVEWLKKNYDVNRYGPPTWKALVDVIAYPLGGNNRAEAGRIASRHRPSELCLIIFGLLTRFHALILEVHDKF